MEHIISVMVENKFGALSRVAGLFSGRGFNIDSLSVGPTIDPTVSMMILVTRGDDRIIEQIIKHLNKQIDVIKVVDLTEGAFVARETVLIKINAKGEDRAEALRITDIFRARVVDSTPATYTVEVTGDTDKIEAMINLLRPLGIKDLVRTGRIAIAREEIKPAVQDKKRLELK
jgi:acetolactate synthase-1/3 small subunit